MRTFDDIAEENRRLRRTMRDLIALSTLPAVWTGLASDGIARSLADVLLNTLSLDFVYVRLTGRTGEGEGDVVRTKHRPAANVEAVRAAVAPLLSHGRADPPSAIPDPSGGGTLHVAVTRFGISDDHGVIVTGSSNPDYPTEQDRLLLGVGANQTAIVVQRRLAEERLREADRRKDEFLATLAHELRNPLAPIRNGLQVLKMSDRQEAREQARTMMERQLEQLVRLVDDLLDVSRISRGRIELKKEPVPIEAVLDGAVETSRPLIDQMGHTLTVTLPDHMVVVDADPTRLAQVFLNLLNNAAKYSDRGSTITLKAERQGSDVVVSVRDTGIGIAADQLPRLFDMFSQVDRSLAQSQGGLGIGLSLVRGLVEMHGGVVEARSEGLGRGSEFVVRLPVVVEASVPPKAGWQGEQPIPRSSLRILVVDDNRDGADSLSEMLRIMGNDTRTAYDGLEGVELAEAFRPDVILLDIGLPKLNGHDACRRIRERAGGRPLVVIAQTGWGADEDRHRTTAAGFDHHMVKPVDPTALMKLLAELHVVRQ
jgi:signal transduction histidine kinase